MNQSSNRYGNARFATPQEIERAGLFGPRGLYLGHMGGRSIRHDSDGPCLTLGGSGCGKLATVLAYNLCLSPEKLAVLDPKGELTAISLDNQVRWSKPAYAFNPYRLHKLPSHRINLTGFIRKGSATLTADLKMLFEDLISNSGNGEGRFFEDTARGAAEMFARYDVERYGWLSLPRLQASIATMIAGGERWETLAHDILAHAPMYSPKLFELIALQRDSERTFSIVAAELTNALAWLSDPMLVESLSEPFDLDLETFCTSPQAANLSFVMPADLLGINAPLLRAVFRSMMIVKGRAAAAPRLNLVVDEAGQLGRAPFLQRAFTFGRGVGIRCWAVFQDTGQITNLYGPGGLQTFLASAEVRQFLGIRDAETAALITKMLGHTTIRYRDDHRAQEARRHKRQALYRFMTGEGDPLTAALDARHYGESLGLTTQMGRELLPISEVLALPDTEQLLFISGRSLPPIRAGRTPYFTDRRMIGHFMPNPYHPPIDAVRVPGGGMARVIRERVPQRYATLPQYADGTWRYVRGFRP